METNRVEGGLRAFQNLLWGDNNRLSTITAQVVILNSNRYPTLTTTQHIDLQIYRPRYTTNLKKWRVGNCPVCHVPGYLSTHNLISRIPDVPPAFKQIITMNNKYKTIKQHLFDPLFNVFNWFGCCSFRYQWSIILYTVDSWQFFAISFLNCHCIEI